MADVQVKECGNVAIVKYAERENRTANILKINREHYIILSTGEYREIEHNKSRIDDILSVRESMERLRDYLNTNVTDNISQCRWLSLTYKECMDDPKRLYADFKRFNRRCRQRYGHYEYITAAEPQARGAWHLHCVLIFSKRAPFMKNADVAEIWGQGFVNIRKLNSISDVGRYLTAYLSDLELSDVKRKSKVKADQLKVVEVLENGKKQSKAVVKGARLALYPRGFHLYRISRGIKPPTITRMKKYEADKKFADWGLTYETTYKLTDGDFENIINKKYYNRLQGKTERGERE